MSRGRYLVDLAKSLHQGPKIALCTTISFCFVLNDALQTNKEETINQSLIDVGSLPVLILEDNVNIQFNEANLNIQDQVEEEDLEVNLYDSEPNFEERGAGKTKTDDTTPADVEEDIGFNVFLDFDFENNSLQCDENGKVTISSSVDDNSSNRLPGLLTEESIQEKNGSASDVADIGILNEHVNDASVDLGHRNETFPTVTIDNNVGLDNNIPENQPMNKKRKRGEGPWVRSKRKERTKSKNEGKGYVTVTGKEVQERKLKDLKECRMKCSGQLDDELRKQIFHEYWALGSRDRRVQFISSLIEVEETTVSRKRKEESNKKREVTFIYHFNIRGQRTKVCKSCFVNTLDEHNKFISLAVANKMQSISGTTNLDKRGHHSPKNKHSQEQINGVINHIKSFPTYESHYTRKTNAKLYLPAHLNLVKLYSLYCEQTNNPVSRTIYEREFNKLNLKFKMRKTDTCHKCEAFKMKLITCENEEVRNEILEKQKQHHESADLAYSAKSKDKERAKNDVSIKCFAFNLQQCLPTPDLQTSVSFYKRLYWTYNLTFHDLATNETTCYLWHEAVANRGANEIASCIYKHIINLPDHVKTVVLYSDTCGGQNKNSHVAAMFTYLMQVKPTITEFHHKFLVPGHTHMECDGDHSVIERQKKKTETLISHPHDWATLIRCTNKKFKVVEMDQENFLDFSGLLNKTGPLVQKFYWRPCCWFKYSSSFGEILFKKSLTEHDSFDMYSLRRRTKRDSTFSLPEIKKAYTGPLPIAPAKKRYLLSLLSVIPGIFHDFYKSLKTANIPDEDPDLNEIDPDED